MVVSPEESTGPLRFLTPVNPGTMEPTKQGHRIGPGSDCKANLICLLVGSYIRLSNQRSLIS